MSTEGNDPRWIEFTLHAVRRMEERGATGGEVEATLSEGRREPAKRGLWSYRKRFPFEGVWAGRSYSGKDVQAIVAEEEERRVVVTVYVFYLGGGGDP